MPPATGFGREDRRRSARSPCGQDPSPRPRGREASGEHHSSVAATITWKIALRSGREDEALELRPPAAPVPLATTDR
jgi:hypothetical protein